MVPVVLGGPKAQVEQIKGFEVPSPAPPNPEPVETRVPEVKPEVVPKEATPPLPPRPTSQQPKERPKVSPRPKQPNTMTWKKWNA